MAAVFVRGWRRVVLSAAVAVCLVAALLSCSRAPADVLTRWRSALAHQSESPATWLAIGDSITEGQGAGARSDRWIDLTAEHLRTGSTGVGVYVPGWYAVYGPDSTWQAAAARTGTVADESSASLGLRSALLTSPASQSYAVTGTSVDLYYATPGGVLAYAVDNSPATDVDTAGAPSSGHRVHIELGARGQHWLTVAAVSGAVSLSGVFAYDGDENSGVHLFDGAHSGYKVGQFVAAQGDLDPVVVLAQPDLVTVELGVNDYLTGDATPDQVRADLKEIVLHLRQQLPKAPSIVLVVPYGIAPPTDGSSRVWEDYAAAIRSLSTEPSVGLLDFSSMGTATPGGSWAADGLHPSDAGHLAMAQRASAYLSGG